MKLKKYLTIFLICGIIPFIKVSEVDTSELTEVRKVEVFIRHNSSLTTKKAKYLAERFIEHGYVRAKWLAATAKVESDFTPSAVGKSGERSMFQILKWPKDKNPLSIEASIQEALKVKKQKEQSWKDPFKSIQAYNGDPRLEQTKVYATKVTNYMRYM